MNLPAIKHPARRLTPILLLLLLCTGRMAFGLTLDEALALARKNMPNYQATLKKVSSSEALYKASLSPYLPSVDGTASADQHHASEGTYNTHNYKLGLTYTLFDGGKRSANRKIAGANLEVDRQEARKTLIDLLYQVTDSFFATLARRDMATQRRMQLTYAKKDHEVAKGRNRLGLVKRSDVLQALVRLEQARYNVIQSEGDMKKSLAELNSLIGAPLSTPQPLAGRLEGAIRPPDEAKLNEAARLRPEIVQAERGIEIAKGNRAVARSAFFPLISANAAHESNDSGIYRTSYPDEDIVWVSANWNFFEWGKFHKAAAASRDLEGAEFKLQEAQRAVLLDLDKAREDFLTAQEKMHAANQQQDYAEHNYRQALGEYQVGKGDILSLVQSESLLADAKGQLIDAKLAVITTKVEWEKSAGMLPEEAGQEFVLR